MVVRQREREPSGVRLPAGGGERRVRALPERDRLVEPPGPPGSASEALQVLGLELGRVRLRVRGVCLAPGVPRRRVASRAKRRGGGRRNRVHHAHRGGRRLSLQGRLGGSRRQTRNSRSRSGAILPTTVATHNLGRTAAMNNAVIEQSGEPAIRTALGTLLIEKGLLDAERLDEALRIGADTGERLGEVIVRMGWASEDDLAKTLADQWHLRYVERSAISFDGDALSRMSREDATRLEALPMRVSEDGAVVVALAEPTDARFLALHELLGDRIDCVVVAKSAIDAGLRSDLLPKDGRSTIRVAAAPTTVPDEDEQHGSNGLRVSTEGSETPAIADATGEPTASDFDEVATTLAEGLSAQLGTLRAIVVAAESTRERDRAEIARLETELADRSVELAGRAAELAERNATIESMQQKLRGLADALELRT